MIRYGSSATEMCPSIKAIIDIHLKFFYKHFFISIKAQIFSIYLIIYHLFKHFAQAQPKSVMLIKKLKCSSSTWFIEHGLSVHIFAKQNLEKTSFVKNKIEFPHFQ